MCSVLNFFNEFINEGGSKTLNKTNRLICSNRSSYFGKNYVFAIEFQMRPCQIKNSYSKKKNIYVKQKKLTAVNNFNNYVNFFN